VPGYETNSWAASIGPARLPREVVQRLHTEIKAALGRTVGGGALSASTARSTAARPRNFLALVRRETPKWADVVKRSGRRWIRRRLRMIGVTVPRMIALTMPG